MPGKQLNDKDRWEREKRILNLKASGMSIVEIADRENIGLDTVRKALNMVYKRYVDLMILDGANALTELVLQSEQCLALALGAFSQAKRVVSVAVEEKTGERVNIEVPDWNAKSLFLGKALEAVRLKATVMGFTRADVTPIINFIQSQNTQINQMNVSSDIRPEDVPKIRRHLRGARALMHRAAAQKIDVGEMHRLAGVKDVPDEEKLLGVMKGGNGDASDPGDDRMPEE
jgi:lambda repressor-like predicted transcriptional regulator